MNIKYGFLEPQLLQNYNNLDLRRKRYVDFRVQGYNKTESYKMAGYNSHRNVGQAAYQLENNPVIKELLDAIMTKKKLDEFADGKGNLKNQIDALSSSSQAKKALKILENATGEEAIRIKFYQDIANGKTKTLEKTTVRDRDGNIKEERVVEKEPSIADRMVARAKLDTIMGLNDMPSEVGVIQGGPITITIVDASNKQQKQDKRNDVVIDADFSETTKQEESEQDE